MRLVGRRRDEQLAVDELVPRRLQRAVGDELPNLAGGPTALRSGHGHNVLGLAMREQEVIRQYAADDASVRHHFIAALIYVGRSGRCDVPSTRMPLYSPEWEHNKPICCCGDPLRA